MPENATLAVVGADSLVGDAVLELLAGRGFAASTLRALDTADAVGKRVEFGGGRLKIQAVEGFDFSICAVAVFCAGAELTRDQAPRAVDAGCMVVDASGCYSADAGVPLVAADVNPDALAAYAGKGVVACPSAAALQLALVLKPLHDAAGVARVNVAAYQSASGLGRSGTEELARQTALLLNGRPVDPQLFPRQLAFNALARVGEMLDSGYTADESVLAEQVRRLLGEQAPGINATIVYIPTFHGDGQVVHLETRDKLDAERARTLLVGAAGLKLLDSRAPEDFPTAVTDAVGSEQVFVGRVREDMSHPRGLDLWTVADNVRAGIARNSVQIVEFLVKKYL